MPATLRSDELVDRKTAAAFLHVSQPTLSRWMKDRVGPPVVKLTDGERGRVLYRRADLEAFVDARTLRPKAK
jgi:predicted DNA-binding transcriptional regulator AlpA